MMDGQTCFCGLRYVFVASSHTISIALLFLCSLLADMGGMGGMGGGMGGMGGGMGGMGGGHMGAHTGAHMGSSMEHEGAEDMAEQWLERQEEQGKLLDEVTQD